MDKRTQIIEQAGGSNEIPAEERVWLVGAEMGYGHLRALHPLRGMAIGEMLVAGVNDGSSPLEKKLWARLRNMYERLSRARRFPYIGKALFRLLDLFLEIPDSYPVRNLSKSTFQVALLESFIKQGLCSGLLNRTAASSLPLVTSFYAPAVAANNAGRDDVYCIICDADLNRVWVPRHPYDSRITYFVPCGNAAQRLRSYGVDYDRIKLTGFPLPEELLGGRDLRVLKKDLLQRLHRLDPRNRFWPLHGKSVEHFLGDTRPSGSASSSPVTITFAVGGAGAQAEFGVRLMRSLTPRLERGEIVLHLVAGVRYDVAEHFETMRAKLPPGAAAMVSVHRQENLTSYFAAFAALLRRTDILWTKPSELTFYCALGIPLILTPSLGSQERFNRRWLLEIQAGMKQENPDFTHQWLYDLLDNGRFAEMAWSGFLKARKLGTYKIQDLIRYGTTMADNSPLMR